MKRHKYFFLTPLVFFLAPALASAEVAAVVFTTTPQIVSPGAVSDTITLQAQDGSGAAVAGGIPSTGCIALTSTSPTGQFSSSVTSWNSISVLTMNKSSSNRNFFYQDTTAGTYTLSAAFVLKPASVSASCASWPQSGWGSALSASQEITIGASSVSVQTETPPILNATSTTAQTITPAQNIGPQTLSTVIKTEPVVMVGGGSFFTASAYDPAGNKMTNVRYIWNFGDGATDEGETTFHTYAYPGKYVVGLSVASGDEAGIGRTTVQAVPAQIGVLAEVDGSVVLTNQAGQELNVGLWSITSGTSTFSIPQDTIILGGQSVRFAQSVMNMDAGTDTILRYPNSAPVATAIPTQIVVPVFIQASTFRLSAPVSQVHVSKKIATTTSTTTLQLAAATEASNSSLPLWSWILGAGGIILIGIGAFSYATHTPKKETNAEADEFEIEG